MFSVQKLASLLWKQQHTCLSLTESIYLEWYLHLTIVKIDVQEILKNEQQYEKKNVIFCNITSS